MILYLPFLSRGICICPTLILIPKWAKGSEAYLAHEQVHAAQQRHFGVFKFWYLYITDKSKRLGFELDAYAVQLDHGASIHACAYQLATGYGIDLTVDQATKLLESYNG
jgi:hypothetical protein